MFEMEVFEEPGRHTLEEHGRHTPVRMDSRTCKARHCVIIVLYSLDLLPVTGGHGASVGNYVMFSRSLALGVEFRCPVLPRRMYVV